MSGSKSSFRPGLCHLNGHILPLEEARVDPRDRGFLFGDALYEGIKVVGGVVLHLDEHLARLRGGLERLRIPEPDDLAGRCRELVWASRLDTGFLYLQVTRGAGRRSRFPPLDLEPTVFAETTERVYDEPAGRPYRVATTPDPRWRHCDLKTTSMLATVTGKLRAREAGADEILFTGDRREIREGGSVNVFAHRGGRLETHPLDGRVLAGVTRRQIIDLAADAGLEVRERAPRLDERDEWTELFLTGTLTGVQPVVELDGRPVGGGAPGRWTRRLAAALADYEQRLVAGPAVPEPAG